MEQIVTGKDLTQVAPRGPNEMVGGYVVLGRTLDKCRALLGGNIGPYHFDCALDNMLFGWKRIIGNDFKKAVAEGRSDEEMAKWVDEHGKQRTPEEKQKWVEDSKKATLYNDPQKRDFFIEEARKLGLDPATTTLFQWLEADDAASYPQAAA